VQVEDPVPSSLGLAPQALAQHMAATLLSAAPARSIAHVAAFAVQGCVQLLAWSHSLNIPADAATLAAAAGTAAALATSAAQQQQGQPAAQAAALMQELVGHAAATCTAQQGPGTSPAALKLNVHCAGAPTMLQFSSPPGAGAGGPSSHQQQQQQPATVVQLDPATGAATAAASTLTDLVAGTATAAAPPPQLQQQQEAMAGSGGLLGCAYVSPPCLTLPKHAPGMQLGFTPLKMELLSPVPALLAGSSARLLLTVANGSRVVADVTLELQLGQTLLR
jgi:hypothetical protein